ncbi:MAG: FAD-dependent oxidoreductase [Bacteroidales bacterium]|nr:FAD-dependent oxidoreductase [Bacteroidales bacterium]
MKKIIILGGGFAGVEAAIKLSRHRNEVVLISDRDYLFMYPVSIWVPTGKKKFDDLKISLKTLANKHGFEVKLEKVVRIDSEQNKVITLNQEHSYDYLILALGMSKLKAKGLEHTHSICGKPDEALVIKEELAKIVARGSGRIAIGFGGNPKDPTATGVRGGPAFELLFNFSHFLKQKGLRDKVQLIFVAPMKDPGRRMGEKPYQKLDLFFKRYRVEKQIGKKITGFAKGKVLFEDQTELQADLIVYIPAGDGHPVIQNSPSIPVTEAGFVKINELCRVDGIQNMYAIGDIAAITGPTWAAKQGHIAEVMADTAAYNIQNEINFKGKRKSYWEHLNIICVMDSGDGAAFIKRTRTSELIVPLPIIGHWLKKGWGFYYKNSKLKRIPRIPGM